jgi:hypothetical protein
MANFMLSLKNLVSLIDSHCIYKERGRICLVELKSLSIEGDMVALTLKPIAAPGFATAPTRIFKVECVSEYLSYKKNSLTASIVGWQLFTGKADVKRLVKFAQGLPDIQAFLDEIRKIR